MTNHLLLVGEKQTNKAAQAYGTLGGLVIAYLSFQVFVHLGFNLVGGLPPDREISCGVYLPGSL